MTVSGHYVKTFAEASHALPSGMHMNADYPFMIPPIVSISEGINRIVTIRGERDLTVSFVIRRRRGLGEYGYIEQSSSFEQIFNRKPTRFRMLPFKDDRTPAIGTPLPVPAQEQTR